MKKHYIIPIFVPHKGCPHDCIFCNQKKITGQTETVDASFVENEIHKYLETIPGGDRIVEVSFFGGSFTGIPINEQIELLTPAKKALDEGLIDAIRLSTRPDYIDENILDMLKKYGASIIELGVQSLDKEVLLLSNRGHTVEDVYKASRLIKEWGFTLGLQMMVGLPGDTIEKDIYTAREFIKIAPNMVRIYPALVVKDTYMEYMYKKGEYTPLSVDEAVDITSRLYLEFTAYDINIIRIGLQPTESISLGGDIVSGPFHPSFRELVESKILNDMMVYLFNSQKSSNVEFAIHSRSLSKLYGGGKRYFRGALNKLGIGRLKISVDDSLPVNTLSMIDGKVRLKLSIKDYSLIK